MGGEGGPTRDGAALLRAIFDEPEEDAHRLVYADWLDENGPGESRPVRAPHRPALARPLASHSRIPCQTGVPQPVSPAVD